MKVYLEPGQAGREGCLLTMGEGIGRREVMEIIRIHNYDTASGILIAKSRRQTLVPTKHRSKTRLTADVAVSQGYNVERLA